MKIAIDLDGVLGDVVGHILPILNKKYNTNYVTEDINMWDFPITHGVSIGKYIINAFTDPAFLLTIPRIDGAKEALKHIVSRGNEIIIVTGRPGFCKRYTYLWLDENFAPSFHGIVFTTKKTVQNTGGCDILIDDSIKYLKDFQKSGGETIQFLSPWNVNDTGISPMSATNWESVTCLLDSIVDSR